ncbi:hypothetical protein KKH46_02995 [Patescibacteria group bacterium]|nr:hypothetical protein [Patescibacteria group bacterium]
MNKKITVIDELTSKIFNQINESILHSKAYIRKNSGPTLNSEESNNIYLMTIIGSKWLLSIHKFEDQNLAVFVNGYKRFKKYIPEVIGQAIPIIEIYANNFSRANIIEYHPEEKVKVTRKRIF